MLAPHFEAYRRVAFCTSREPKCQHIANPFPQKSAEALGFALAVCDCLEKSPPFLARAHQIASPDSDFAVQDLCFSPKRGDEAVLGGNGGNGGGGGLLGGEQGIQQRQQQQRWETAR